MSAEQNIETARQMYQAFGRGDVQAILDRVTDDVDWSTDAAIESAPWYGPRHGKDGLISFFEAIGKTGPVTEFTPLAFASNDDGDVMVFLRYAFTVTATGKHVAMNMHHYWRFRDGQACFVRSSEDTAQVAAALGVLPAARQGLQGQVEGRSGDDGRAIGVEQADALPGPGAQRNQSLTVYQRRAGTLRARRTTRGDTDADLAHSQCLQQPDAAGTRRTHRPRVRGVGRAGARG